ncbi:MAG: hypothetical protein ABEJ26_03160 [Halosimplex sp.]
MSNREDADDGNGIKRRTALKGSAAGLAALGLSGFATNAAASPKKDSGGNDGTSGANQFRFAGEDYHIMSASSAAGENTSPVETLMQINGVKQSSSWQDSLVFEPSVESSLMTDVKVSGNDGFSRAAAGVLGWIEIRPSGAGDDAWQMVTVDDELVDPPTASNITDEGDLSGDSDRIDELARGVVAFNTRDLALEWDLESLVEAAVAEVESVVETLQENYTWSEYQGYVASHNGYNRHESWLASHDGITDSDAEVFVTTAENEIGTWSEYQTFVADASSYDDLKAELLNLDIFTAIYLETKSANSFNWVKTATGGEHDVRLRGALHVFVDPDDDADVYAKAIVGNRTMLCSPTKIKARVSSRDDPNS